MPIHPRLDGRLRSVFIAALLPLICIGAGRRSVAGQEKAAAPAMSPPPATAYAGDAACRTCHEAEAATYLKTAHHSTSSLPTAAAVGGSFTPGLNLLHTSNPDLVYVMNAAKQGFFETAIDAGDPSHSRALTEPIDIVIGSGRKAHSYLYWKGDELFELPVSWWRETSQWINSPGYPDGSVHFDRPIVPRCLDCHGSYFESLQPPINRYRKSSVVLGITCEKCHGPGREHVFRERSASPPGRGSSRLAIVSLAHLPRERQLDLCALCHAGAATPIAPTLSFMPGDDIGQYLKLPDPGPTIPVDVHGNQVLALRRSRCFQSSMMTCATCHDVHKTQRDVPSFSARCLTCHEPQACGEFARIGATIRTKCIDCHMPLQPSEALFSDTSGQRIRPLVRAHRIAIYSQPAP